MLRNKTSRLLAATLLLLQVAQLLVPIEVYSNRFIKPAVNSSGEDEVFFIKGVDYQPGGSSEFQDDGDSDVLSDEEVCYRDVYALQQLGVNTIRVYTVNPDVNHDKCMSILNDAGIYVILDLGSSTYSIYREDPEDSYNYGTLQRFFKVVDAFKNYPNVLGFFVGNEVINDGASALDTPRYIRAFQRDVKTYIKNNANRTIPVGYSLADVTELRQATWEYFQCNIDGEEDLSKSDFFGLNSYEWCSGTSDWSSSGYGKVNSTFAQSTIPVFFSEYGCNTNSPRTFTEVSEGLYDGLLDSLSGGLVYEYSQETSDYGLVSIDDSDGSITYEDDWANLLHQYDKLDLPTIARSDVSNHSIVKCSAKDVEKLYSDFGANFTLPSTPDDVLDMILYGVNNSNIGKIVSVESRLGNYTVTDNNSTEIDDPIVEFAEENLINSVSGTASSVQTSSRSASSSASSTTSKTSTKSKSSKSKDLAIALVQGYGNVGVITLLTFLISLL